MGRGWTGSLPEHSDSFREAELRGTLQIPQELYDEAFNEVVAQKVAF